MDVIELELEEVELLPPPDDFSDEVGCTTRKAACASPTCRGLVEVVAGRGTPPRPVFPCL